MIGANLKVSDLMSTQLIVAHIDDTMEFAEFDMKTANVRHVLVVDQNNRLAGVVSDRDVLRAFGARGDNSLILGAIMSTNPITIGDIEPARKALEVMLEHKISCLPVEGEDGQLVGVVTETDFMRLLHHEMTATAD